MIEKPVLETPRLRLHRLEVGDAPFILELFTDPAFLRSVGDKGIRSLEDAEEYLRAGPLDSYEKNVFGLYRVDLAASAISIGICGLLQRDFLPDPDLGFAFLAAHRARGYATESGRAAVTHARDDLGLERLLAITRPENGASRKVLEKLGFAHERMIRPDESEPAICLYRRALA